MKLLIILIPVGVVIVLIAVVIPIATVFTRKVETEDPLVYTSVGLIRGLRAEDGSAMFLGIPYAIVDRNNPFGPAILNPTFDVFNAFNDSARCPQLAGLSETTLDCLHLSIHVPKTVDNTPLPVFVFIHGGGFTSRSSGINSFGPKFLTRHNVVFVSFNYRLSAYGFMCLHTAEVPGNQGLRDQLNALRWIKNNIKAFGGDDESITIAGDSAGGISVTLHLQFAEEGLFHKVIASSGTSLIPAAFPEPDLDVAFKIANKLGFQTNNASKAVAFLSKQTPSQVLLAAQAQQILFRPCVEKMFPNIENYATIHPVSAPVINAKNIPLISGCTDDEAFVFHLNTPPQVFETLELFDANMDVGFDFGTKHEAMKLFVRRFYTADEPMSANLKRAVIDFESDFRYLHSNQRMLEKYLNHGGVAYNYIFSYIGGRNWQRVRFNITGGGATHVDDLGYILDLPEIIGIPTSEDQLMIDRMTTLWTNFAKFGNPTPSTTDLLPVQWLQITRDRLNYLHINLEMELRTRPFHQRLSFWDFFYYANKEYVRGNTNETFTMD